MQNEAVALLRCPICSGSFHQEGKSLLCGKRHCYDIAKQGHVNFAPNAKPSFYKQELFESRARAVEAGVFLQKQLQRPQAGDDDAQLGIPKARVVFDERQ